MQRLKLFILLLTIAAGILLILVAASWYLAVTSQSYYQSSWMSQMWGGMMGGRGMMGGGSGTSSGYLWIIPIGLIAVVILAVIGVSFYLIFPEIRSSSMSTCTNSKAGQVQTVAGSDDISSKTVANLSDNSNTCDILLKTMTPEEQTVLNVLRAHHGKYLQKYIGKEAGLSRLKTHRVLARFAQRGIVTAKKFGNTNEISLSDWVRASDRQEANT